MRSILHTYKKAYSGLSRETWLLSLVMFINRSGTMVMPFMTLYITQTRGYTIAQAGWVMSCFGLGAITGGLVGGRLADRFGFYYVQVVALLGGAVLFLVLKEAHQLSHICIIAYLLATVNDAFRPANAAAIGHYTKEGTSTKSFSLNRLAINLGWMFGGSLGGFIAAHSYPLLFEIDALTNFLAACVLWFYLAPSRSSKAASQPKTRRHTRNKISSPWRDRAYLLFIGCTIIYALIFFQLFTTVPVFYREKLLLSENIIGLTFGISGLLIALVEMILINHLEGRRHPLWFVAFGTFWIALSFLLYHFGAAPLLIALLATLVVTFGEILSMPFMNSYWIGRAKPETRGDYAGLFTMAWAIAQVVGPSGGTYVVATYGFSTLWWMVAVLGLCAAAGYYFLRRMS